MNAFNYITSVKDEPYEALSFITDVYNKVRVVLGLLLDCGYLDCGLFIMKQFKGQ